MKLISDPKAALSHYSTIALTFAGSVQGMWAALPDHIKADLPDTFAKAIAWVTFFVAMAGLGGKFIEQKPKDAP